MADGPVTPAYRYRATVDRVIDGDTYIMRLDLGFRASVAVTIRVRGINTPEMTGANEKLQGYSARDAAQRLLNGAHTIVVETYKDQQSFSRWVGDVYIDGESIAERLISDGYGLPFDARGMPNG
jgi:Kyanoviridae endonuclease